MFDHFVFLLCFIVLNILIFALLFALYSPIHNKAEVGGHSYAIDLPEEASEISHRISKPDTLVSYIHGDTIHFLFINKNR